MDNGEYHISTVDNMDTTLAELGDEFTLGDIDGELVIWLVICLMKLTSVVIDSSAVVTQAQHRKLIYVTRASVTKFTIQNTQLIVVFKNRRRLGCSIVNSTCFPEILHTTLYYVLYLLCHA